MARRFCSPNLSLAGQAKQMRSGQGPTGNLTRQQRCHLGPLKKQVRLSIQHGVRVDGFRVETCPKSGGIGQSRSSLEQVAQFDGAWPELEDIVVTKLISCHLRVRAMLQSRPLVN